MIKQNKNSGFKVLGVPDTPYSLMEGLGGTIVACTDFLGQNFEEYKDLDIKYPGYEI